MSVGSSRLLHGSFWANCWRYLGCGHIIVKFEINRQEGLCSSTCLYCAAVDIEPRTPYISCTRALLLHEKLSKAHVCVHSCHINCSILLCLGHTKRIMMGPQYMHSKFWFPHRTSLHSSDSGSALWDSLMGHKHAGLHMHALIALLAELQAPTSIAISLSRSSATAAVVLHASGQLAGRREATAAGGVNTWGKICRRCSSCTAAPGERPAAVAGKQPG